MSYINKENIDLFILFYQPMYDDSEKKIIAGFFIKRNLFHIAFRYSYIFGVHLALIFISAKETSDIFQI